jgi:hypothetical protein
VEPKVPAHGRAQATRNRAQEEWAVHDEPTTVVVVVVCGDKGKWQRKRVLQTVVPPLGKEEGTSVKMTTGPYQIGKLNNLSDGKESIRAIMGWEAAARLLLGAYPGLKDESRILLQQLYQVPGTCLPALPPRCLAFHPSSYDVPVPVLYR